VGYGGVLLLGMCRSGVIMAKAGLIPVVAWSLFALAIGGLSIDQARAQDTRAQDSQAPDAHTAQTRAPDNCLPAPTGKPPAGNHWHYRTDPTTQTKCFFLRPASDTAQKPATQDKPGTNAAAAAPATPDQAGQDAQPSRPAARPASAGKPNARHQAADRSETWPDPPSQGGAGNVTWPAAPPPAAVIAPEPTVAPQQAAAPRQATAPPQPAASVANDQQEAPAPAQGPDRAAGADSASDRQAIEPATTAAAGDDDMPVGLLLALAAAMLIAGILLRRIVKSLFARGPKIAVARREPVLSTNKAGERTITLPLAHQTDLAPGWVDRLDGDVQDALRKLLRNLEQQAA
jgi:hypothetical protein